MAQRNKTIVSRTPGGIVYPKHIVQEERREKQKFGPLEIQDDEDRKRVGKLLAELRNLPCFRGVICLESKYVYESRVRLWRYLASELLGEGWDCEVLC